MQIHYTKSMRVYITIGALLAWFAVILQLYLIIENRVRPIFDTIIQFFSYFTILTNILVAICFTMLLLQNDSGRKNFFARPKVLTAVTVYITIVGLVYNIILRFLWKPEGTQLIADELLHSVNPVVFVLFWLLFVPKKTLQWKDAFPWLIYPFIYCVYILIRGAFSGLYPYPFIDVTNLGYKSALINIGFLFLAFLLISLLFIAVGKLMAKPSGNIK